MRGSVYITLRNDVHLLSQPEIRRMPSFPSQNDNIGGRRPQRALSFETAEQASAYSRPRGSGGFRRQPVRSSGDFSNGANNDTFNRAPRSHRPNDHAAWPRPESAVSEVLLLICMSVFPYAHVCSGGSGVSYIHVRE